MENIFLFFCDSRISQFYYIFIFISYIHKSNLINICKLIKIHSYVENCINNYFFSRNAESHI